MPLRWRVVALLIVPCLIADPSLVSVFPDPAAVVQFKNAADPQRFNEEALAACSLRAKTILLQHGAVWKHVRISNGNGTRREVAAWITLGVGAFLVTSAFYDIYLGGPWIRAHPAWWGLSLFPIAALNTPIISLLAHFIENKVLSPHKASPKSLGKRILGLIAWDFKYCVPIEGFLIYGWFLHKIHFTMPAHPHIGGFLSFLAVVLLETLVLSPLLMEPEAFDSALGDLEGLTPEESARRTQNEALLFYRRTWWFWNIVVLIAWGIPYPIMSYAALNIGIILWDLYFILTLSNGRTSREWTPKLVQTIGITGDLILKHIPYFLPFLEYLYSRSWFGTYLKVARYTLRNLAGVLQFIYLGTSAFHMILWLAAGNAAYGLVKVSEYQWKNRRTRSSA